MIYYEPHPVSLARKRELQLLGFKIVDAVFAPADWKPNALQTEKTEAKAETPAPVKRGGRPRKDSE